MSQPLSHMKLIVACPTYGPVDPECQRQLRVGIMFAAKLGVQWEGDASPNRMGWSTARNHVAQELVESDPEQVNGIMWVDSDIRQSPRSIGSLLYSAYEFNKDFVSGLYFQRMPPYKPVFYQYDSKVKKYRESDMYPENKFAPADACGFGFVYTSRRLIEGISKSKDFDPENGWFPDERDSGGNGEDISFCDLARKAGFQLFINTGVQVGHLGEAEVVYRKQYDKYRELVKLEEKKPIKKKWGMK